MRSATERLVAAGLVILVTACEATPSSSPVTTSAPPATPIGSPAREPASPTADPADSAGTEIVLPTPGTPWDGTTLLDEMRGSARPGGVPDQVETVRVAEAVAATVRTVDGTAWDTMAIGGFCGSSTCTIDLAGAHLGRAGEDLWTLEVDPATGSVEVLVAEVRSLPWDLVEALDRLARSLDSNDELSAMTLATARWLPPPAEPGRFVLSYRSGGEEGSCSRELLLDAARGEFVEQSASGC